jgi:hypothetical protein
VVFGDLAGESGVCETVRWNLRKDVAEAFAIFFALGGKKGAGDGRESEPIGRVFVIGC